MIAVAVIAFALGYFVSDTTSKAEERETQRAERSTGMLTGKRDSMWNSGKGATTSRRDRDPSLAVTSEHPESREFFAKIGVTREDLQRVEQMEKRRAQGEYILQNERPTTK
jgi:hypothetical protein